MKTFAVLKSLPCDVFLGAHGAYFGLLAKYEKFKAGDKSAFIDPQGYKDYVVSERCGNSNGMGTTAGKPRHAEALEYRVRRIERFQV